MSGGHFDYKQYNVADLFGDEWRDEEINELFADLFGGYGYGDHIDLVHELDWWICGDSSEDEYRDAVRRFKDKWFGRTHEVSAEFYAEKLQERCDELKRELGAIG